MASPASLTFASAGAASQSVSLSQAGNNGVYNLATSSAITCAGIATFSLPTSAGTFTVTPIGIGNCTITATGDFGQAVALPVSVTTSTSITITIPSP